MFITLTNASPIYKGQSISLNSDFIATYWRGDAVRGINEETGEITEKEEVTFVFLPPHGTWEVLDLPEDISKKLNK
jgi:hypothetical protein